MKKSLFAVLITLLGLSSVLIHATTVDAKTTNRLIKTTKLIKTGYAIQNNQGAIYNMNGTANNIQLKKTGLLRAAGNQTWFVTQQRQLRLANNRTQTYYYVTSANNLTRGWVETSSVKKSTSSFTNLYRIAQSKLGHRYVYGAVGPNTFDCSGYTKYVFQQAANKTLPRIAQAQYYQYHKVNSRSAKPGDLVFFGDNTGSITHVGIYVGDGQMIAAQDNGVENERIYVPW